MLPIYLASFYIGVVPLVGMAYEGWHAPAYFGRQPTTPGSPASITVEGVIRSNASLSSAAPRNSTLGMSFYYHSEPASGFYCIYRKRSNESVSSCGLPDCPNITATLARHAAMLVEAGVDFVVLDSTNFQHISAGADALQLRPFEVVAEEWLKLRSAGLPTPRIAAWQNLADPTGDLWSAYVDGVYANHIYDDLLFADAGRKVFFTTHDPTEALVERIEAPGRAGGAIIVVPLWAERADGFAQGEWSFFSPCTDAEGSFTSSVLGGDGATQPREACAQKSTTHAKIGKHGTSLTVSPSYQLSYSSLPFRASAKLGGLTLAMQFEEAFARRAKGDLDYLFVGTFNEHIAQPQHNPYNPPIPLANSMGLEGDAGASHLFVDMYGESITRDLEPTKEDGGAAWELFRSCMRVFRDGGASPTCSNASEPCCTIHTAPRAQWRSVWSLIGGGGGGGGGGGERGAAAAAAADPFEAAFLLTVDSSEVAALTKKGGGWREVCTPFGGSAVFCNPAPKLLPSAPEFRAGPFLMHAAPLPTPGASRAVTRCNAGSHFFTLDPACAPAWWKGGAATVEGTLGYTRTARSSETPRSLRLCQRGATFHHSLDAPCEGGAVEREHLGYVH